MFLLFFLLDLQCNLLSFPGATLDPVTIIPDMNMVESFMEAPHQGADSFFEEPSQLAVKQEGIIGYETIQYKNHICFENTQRRSPTIHVWC